MKIGIDAIDYYVPPIALKIKDLAEARNIPPAKLEKGLGLKTMALIDTDEDVASMAANALLNLIINNKIDPTTIGRIYLGTESALDASKPTATYAVGTVENVLKSKYGIRCFKNCDVVDLTFACIGAIDAMENCMDWVRAFPDRKAIVIASDVAKYELKSSGEYTQGAGAVAILIANNPAILELNQTIGVGMEHVGDFFKPRKTITNKDLKNTSIQEITKSSKEKIELYVEEPVFDGYYSNTCYQNRISEALEHFNKQKETDFLNDWDHLIFHLPYAFQGRRMMLDIWLDWINGKVLMEKLEKEIGKLVDSVDVKVWKKAASKSSFYQNFVRQKIEAGEKASMQIGNMYTASVFMSFLSFLTVAKDNQKELVNNVVGFLSYGSGSKSKILEGKVVDTWRKKINHLNIFESLDNRNFIDFKTYEKLHNNSLDKVIIKKNSMVLKEISNQENMQGFRYYS